MIKSNHIYVLFLEFQLGFSVGHHVRFSQLYPPQPGTIIFVSSGMLLQRLVVDPSMSSFTNLIMVSFSFLILLGNIAL